MASTKALILTSSFLPTIGGGQYQLKWFLDNLDPRLNQRNDVQVHFVYPNQDSKCYSRFDNIHAHDLQLSDFRKPTIARMLVRFGNLLRKIRPDVIHCLGVLPEGLWVLLASMVFRVRAKLIVTSHGQDVVWLPEVPYGLRQSRRSRILAKLVTARIDAHVLVSHAMIEHAIAAGTPPGRTLVIPNGIPVGEDCDFESDAMFHSSESGGYNAESRYAGGLDFLSLSSGRDIKNVKGLIEAFALARGELGGSRLLLACEGPLAQPIVQLAVDKGLSEQVIFTGKVLGADKHQRFLASDVYCLPSHFEAFGLVALEAMKFGTPVLATNKGGLPDFVEDGVNGLLAAPTDIEGMASAMVRLYNDSGLRRRLAEGGLQTVKRFSISRIVDEYVELYRRVGGQ